MQNFANDNYNPEITYYKQLPDPNQNEPFNRATQPSDKPIINKHYFALDSRQRDFNKYPNSNNYNISIPERYRNVTSIELKAAMLPRSEYNVNSSNKCIDISVGDFISSVSTFGSPIITNKGKFITPGTYLLNIEAHTLNNVSFIQAEVNVIINSESKITTFIIVNSGSGYSYSKPPRISLFDFENFIIKIGFQYTAELREGQYSIGGNPQYYDQTTSNSVQSWTPNNLLCELENALSFSVFNNTDYCYSRRPWTSESSIASSTKDYPLFFNSRLMSQYPQLDFYKNGHNGNINNYSTNSCQFNRIYLTNSLIFKTSNLHYVGDNFTDDSGFSYNVLKVENIIMGAITQYLIFCSLNNPLTKVGGKFWNGIDSNDYIISHWEILFASGINKIINSSSLLGFNKKNYYNTTNNNVIEIKPNISDNTTLIPNGLTYSAENDYYLFGDPEYVVLSFRPRYGGNTISGINDRVDSQPDSNIDRIFACLIYDTVQPSVLSDVSSGKLDSIIGSLGTSNNSLSTFLNYDNNEIKQLVGNSGNQNVNYNKPPGQLKAMKGADFDRKIVEFPQPIAQIFDLNVRFTKFTKLGSQGLDDELYDFHGKEHLLLFEITCSDLLTGKRS
jgi:hypothetical protein